MGGCYIDREGCLETAQLHGQRVLGDEDCPWYNPECEVTISDDWEGSLSLDVVAADFELRDYGYRTILVILTLNGQTHSLTSTEDLEQAGVQGRLVAGTFSWFTHSGCIRVKICPAVHAALPGPWGDTPWTCTVSGDPCKSTFIFKGLSFSACTQQFSDPFDADHDGSLHNGHPQCESETGLFLCGPCSCAEGEEQTYNISSVYPHTQSVGLVACAPCAAGRFKSLGGSGSSDSCAACTHCLPGTFNDYEMLECASCQAGFFSDGVGRTVCQECGDGLYRQHGAVDGVRRLSAGFLLDREGRRVPTVLAWRIPQPVDDRMCSLWRWTFPEGVGPVGVPPVQCSVQPWRSESSPLDDHEQE